MRRAGSVLLVVLATLLAACGSSNGESGAEPTSPETTAATDDATSDASDDGTESGLESLIAAAQDEGSLVFYGSANEDVVAAVAEAFEEEYGISVEYIRLVTGQLLQRYAAEAEAGSVAADAVIASHGDWGTEFVDNGWLTPVKDVDIPGVDEFPDELYDLGLAKVGSETHGIAINTDLVSGDDIPTDWSDLADPKWDGQILLIDPSSSAGYPSTWVHILDEYGSDLLQAIGDHAVRTTEGMTPNFEQLAAGEGAIGVPSLASTANGLAASGAPVQHIQPDFAPMFFHSLGVTADAPHPNAAKLFAHFVMVGHGQYVLNDPERFGRCPPVTREGCPENAIPQEVAHLERADEIYELLGVNGG